MLPTQILGPRHAVPPTASRRVARGEGRVTSRTNPPPVTRRLLRPRQWGGLRREVCGQAFRHFPTAAHRGRIRRHGRGSGPGPTDYSSARRTGVGGRKGQRRRGVLLYAARGGNEERRMKTELKTAKETKETQRETGFRPHAPGRSAGFQPAVSPASSRQIVLMRERIRTSERLRRSLASRVGNPRHSRLEVCATVAVQRCAPFRVFRVFRGQPLFPS